MARFLTKSEKEPTVPRRRTVPVAPWWIRCVLARMGERKKADPSFNQKALAIRIKEDTGAISRCLSGKKPPVYEVTIAISDELGLPYPALLPDSFEEAQHLAMQRRLFKSDRHLGEIAAGVANARQPSRTHAVTSDDGRAQPRRKTPSTGQ